MGSWPAGDCRRVTSQSNSTPSETLQSAPSAGGADVEGDLSRLAVVVNL